MRLHVRTCGVFALLVGVAYVGAQVEASDVTWEAYHDAAVRAAKTKDYAKAKRLFTEAIEEAAVHHPDGRPELIVQSVLGISGILIHEGDYTDAEKILKDALKLSESLGPQHAGVAQLHSDLSQVYFETGKLDDAEKHVRAAMDRTDAEQAPAQISSLLNDLANIERIRKKYDEAEALARRAISLAETSAGSKSTQTAEALDTLAEIHLDRGQHEDALALAEKALEIAGSNLSANHPFLAEVHDTLADVHAALDHKEKAVEHSSKVAEINKAHFHRYHSAVTEALKDLHDRLLTAGKKEEASKVRADLEAREARRAKAGQTQGSPSGVASATPDKK